MTAGGRTVPPFVLLESCGAAEMLTVTPPPAAGSGAAITGAGAAAGDAVVTTAVPVGVTVTLDRLMTPPMLLLLPLSVEAAETTTVGVGVKEGAEETTVNCWPTGCGLAITCLTVLPSVVTNVFAVVELLQRST